MDRERQHEGLVAPGVVATRRPGMARAQPVLLRTELGAGHAGPSGRYDAWRDEAFVLAFAIHAVGS